MLLSPSSEISIEISIDSVDGGAEKKRNSFFLTECSDRFDSARRSIYRLMAFDS